MTVQLAAVVLDAAAPEELARFWAHALRWSLGVDDGAGVELVPTDATSFRVVFRPNAVEKVGQSWIHFDLTTASDDDRRDTVAELVALGGRRIDIGQGPDALHVVLADPEGNELCIIEPDAEFLAGCPRLGAVNCDGTPAVGRFYSGAFGWPLVWEQGDETAIQAPDGTGPKITWSVHPAMQRPRTERFHLQLAPTPGTGAQEALDHLLALGATRLEVDHACPDAIALADVDGNDLCLRGFSA